MSKNYYCSTFNYTTENLGQINDLFKLNPNLNSDEILNKTVESYSRRKIKDFFLCDFPYFIKNHYSSFQEKRIPFLTFSNKFNCSFVERINFFKTNFQAPSVLENLDDLNNLHILDAEKYSQQNLIKAFIFKQNQNQEETFNINVLDYSLKEISTYNEKPVFSVFSKDIYNAANIANPDYFDEDIVSNINFKIYNLPNSFNQIFDTKEIKINNLNFFNFEFNFDLTNYLDSINSSKLQVLKVPSWSSRAKDRKIEFTNYTKNQIIKRKICLIPVLFKIKYLTPSLQEKDCYIFSFISNAIISEIENKKNPKARFKDLINILFDFDGLKLVNPEKYQKLLTEKLKNLATFSSTHLENLDPSLFETLLSINNPDYDVFSSDINASILNKPKIDLKLEEKYNKFKTLIDSQNLNIKSSNLTIDLHYLKRKKESLLIFTKEIKDLIERIENDKKALLTNFETFSNSFNYLSSNYSLYNEIKSKYNSAINNSYKEQKFETNDFLNNLTKENIFIHSITYTKTTNSDFVLTTKNFETLSDQDKIDFYTNVSKNKYKIKKVTFLLNSPVEIKVVGKNQSVYGGPYFIEVTNNKLMVKLAYNSSLFGSSSGDKYYIHPHTGFKSNITSLFDWSSACLGEASPLIYNAFEKNDLKLILLSALTWVRSANAADPWGSNYIYFPTTLNPLSFDLQFQKEEITDSDVDDFLGSFQTEEEEEEEEELLQTTQNIEENQINNDYVPFATYNTLNET